MSEFIGVGIGTGKNFRHLQSVKAIEFGVSMKRTFILASLLVTIVAAGLVAGCSKSGVRAGSRKDGRITGSPSDPAVAFIAQWAPSNRYVFRSEISTFAEVPRQGQAKPVPQESTLGLDYVITVSNVNSNGSKSLELEITSVQFESTMGETMLISYDSMNKVVGTDGNAMAERFEKIIGSKITFQLSASNKISNVRGISEITNKLYNGGTARAQTLVRRLFTPQYLRHLIDLIVLPADPVRIKDSWSGQMALNSGPLIGGITGDVTYTFRGWQEHDQRKCALVEFTGTVKPRGKPGGPIANNMENGTINGKTWFDPELGIVVESISDQAATSKGSIKWRRAGTNAPPQSYTSNFRQHTSIKLVDVEVNKPAT